MNNLPRLSTRRKVFVIALVLLVVGYAIQWWPGGLENYAGLSAACIRIGAVMAVLWLALPETARPQNRWLLLGLGIMAVVIVVRPKLILLALVVMAAIAILRPRLPAQPRRRVR